MVATAPRALRSSVALAMGRGEWLRRGAVLAVPAVVALIAGVWGMSQRQLWRDEIVTWSTSSLSYSGVLGMANVTDAVLTPYYLFMHAWMSVFGDSAVAMRLPSLLAIAAAAALTAALGRHLFGPATGLIGGLLVAVAPSMSRYAQEARPYAMAVAAATLATLLLVQAVHNPTWPRWVGYGVALALTGWLHLVAMLIVAAHLAYLASTWRQTSERRLVRGAVTMGVGLLAVAPLAWWGTRQTSQVAWIPPATWDSTVTEISRVSGTSAVGALITGLALLACWPPRRDTGMLALWALLPFGVLFALTGTVDLLLHRYVVFTLPAWCLLAASIVVSYTARATPVGGSESASENEPAEPARRGRPDWRRHGVPAVLVVACLLAGLPTQGKYRDLVISGEADLRGAVAAIAAEAAPGDRIGLHARNPEVLSTGARYYLRDSPSVPTAFIAWPGKAANFPEECGGSEGCLAGGGRLWLIGQPGGDDPLAGMEPSLRAELLRAFVLVKSLSLTGITVSLWKPVSPPRP